MKHILISLIIMSLGQVAFSQWQAQTLGAESLYNNKKFIVSNLDSPDGIKVKVNSVNKGEPAALSIYLYPQIKCNKKSKYKTMDIGKRIKKTDDPGLTMLLGAPEKGYPSGVVHVCAIDNVNFDSQRIFFTVFGVGVGGMCDRSKVMDLIYPISDFCKK